MNQTILTRLIVTACLCTSSSLFAQNGNFGVGTIAPQTTFHVDGAKDNPTAGAPDSAAQQNDFVVTPAGNIGIGTTNPTAKLELSSGINGVSGLKFNNINSSTSANNSNTSSLGVDSAGNVVIQNSAPVQTIFKSFTIDADVATNSVVTVGTLEFRYAGNCINGNTYMQIRSTSGANNSGIIHGIYLTAQNSASLVNTTYLPITPTFTNMTLAPMNCVQDGHAQFSFFSYTDRTYYRVNVHIADGDNLGFGALGYIYVEYQR